MKYLKYSLKPFAVVLALAVIAMVAAHDILYGAEDQNKPKTAAVMPEVLVRGGQENKKKTYNPKTVSSPKYTEPLRDIPQTITVVPQAVIEDQNATTLREALQNVPGIGMQAGEGGVPAGDQFSIRGFSSRTDLFIDGVRDFGGYTRDTFNFEQVEVVKGPASSYVGRGSTGGSVNLVSKAPELDERFYRVHYGLGTDEYMRSTFDFNQPLKDAGLEHAAFRLNAMLHKADVPGRKVADNKRWAIAPSISFGLETATRFTLSFFHMFQNNNPDYGIPWVPTNHNALRDFRDRPAPTDFSHYYGLSERDYEKVTTDLATAKLEHDFNDSLSLRQQFRFGNNYRDSIITAPRFSTNLNSTDIVRTDWKSREQTDRIFASQTDLTSRFETFNFDHTLVTGFEVIRETETNFNRVATGPNSSTTPLNSPNPADPYLENIQRNNDKAEATAKSLALYGFDTIDLTEHWSVNGGLRYDYFNVNFTPTVTGQSLRRDDHLLSWSSGLVFKPLETGSIYFGYGTSVNPTAEGLTPSTTASSTANINSDPERSRTFEVGTKWDLFKERLGMNAAVFRTDKTNARTEDPSNPNDIVVLEGNQRIYGFELGAAGNLTEDWKVFSAYTYLNSDITKSKDPAQLGKELSNTPRHSFNIWSTYQLPFNLEVGAGLNFVDTRFNNNTNLRKAPSYILFNAMAGYRLTDHIMLRLNLYNLTDQEYIDNVGGGHFIPGPGRSGTLTTELEF